MQVGDGDVRVLVVDDEEVFRDVGRALVDATAGFELVGEACSGEAAIECVAELAPDLVVMDYRMGGLDGVAAARLIAERHPGTSVLLVSAGPLDDGALDGCGALAFVPKHSLSPQRLREVWTSGRNGAGYRPAR